MKIKFKNSLLVKWGSLKPGDLVRYTDDDAVYMKIASPISVDMSEFNAVILTSGTITYFDDDEYVVLLNGTLIID